MSIFAKLIAGSRFKLRYTKAMMQPVQIAPSILSADFLNLEKDVSLLARVSPAPEWLHVDVMDGHFVPNLTIGPPLVRALKQAFPQLPLDVHLMIDNPAEQLDWYLQAGADLLTVHLECAQPNSGAQAATATKGSSATLNVLSDEGATLLTSLLARIRTAGALAGISLNPNTPIALLEPLKDAFDLVLVMSVHPGFGGQSFIPAALTKIETLASWCTSDSRFLIEVDGGITALTAPKAVAAGANILVAGNAIFAAPDPCAALAELREAVRR